MKYYLLLLGIVILFFNQIIFGKIPFPGDLLASENPYKESSYLGFVPGSIPNKAQGGDVIKEIYPWRFFAFESLKKGIIPFWNPYNFSGNPQFANFQTAVFYPLNIFYFILPFNLAWTFLIILQPLMAGVFMFLFGVKALKVSRFAAFIGAIAFAFSSYMTVWIEYGNIGHTMLWLPLTLLFVKRLSEKISATNFLGISLSLTLSFLGGYIQGLFYIYAFSFIYYLYLTKLKNLRRFLYFSLALVTPFLLGAFQLLPTLQLFGLSTRGSYSLDQISNLLLPIQSTLTLFAADFFGNPATRNYYLTGTYIERVIYIGVPILFFAFLSFISKSKNQKFFAFFAIFSLLVSTNLPFVKYLYGLPIPVVSTTVPTRELSIFIFSMIILAVFGIDYWEKNRIKLENKIALVFPTLYLVLWLAVFLSFKLGILNSGNFSITARNLILPSVLAILTFVSFRLRDSFGKILLTIIVVADLFFFFQKLTPFSSTQLVYPETPVVNFLQKNAGINRFWGYGSAYVPANFQTVDKTYSPEGNDPLHIASYGQLLASSGNSKIPELLPRPDANVAPGFGKEDLRNNFYRKRILDLLGVKYVVHKSNSIDTETFPSDFYNLVWRDSTLQIYENRNSLPRYFMANSYVLSKNREEVLNKIYDKNINLKKTILLEEKPQINIDKSSQNSVKLLSYTPNKVLFETNSTGNSLFFLSDNYYPDWRVRIDGKDGEILRANYSFRAVALPKGTHTVMMSYFPPSFIFGSRVSVVGLVLLAIVAFLIKKNEKR